MIPKILDREFSTITENRYYWEQQRREELLDLFVGELYGRISDGISLPFLEEYALRNYGRYMERKIWLGTESFKIRLNLYLPSRMKKYPVILYMCLHGQEEKLCVLNTDKDPWCDSRAEKVSCELSADIFDLYPQEISCISYILREGTHDMNYNDWEEIMKVSQI